MAGAEITLKRKSPLLSLNKKTKVLFLLLSPCVILIYLLQPYKWFDRPCLLPPKPGLHDSARAKAKYTEASVNEILKALKRQVPEVNQTQLELTSSGAHSLVTLINPKENYCVGEIVSVRVEMNDYRGKPKTYGGDFILARIHSPQLKAGAAGVSEDFNNGTYRVNFTLFWPGSVKVSVRLIHSSEVVSAFWRTKESGSDKIMFTGIFLNKTKQEKSRCDVHLITNETVCDLKKDSFYCVKPKTLPCETLYYTTSRNTEAYCLTDAENRLMKRSEVGVTIQNKFQDIQVITCTDRVPQAAGKCQLGMSCPTPSGFFHSDRWNSSYCRMSHFQNANDINQCLQGKQVYMWGDSTVRQWFEYLKDHLKDLAYTSTTESAVRRLAIDKARNITIYWKMHGFPCIASRPCAVDNGLDVAQELDRFAGGENTVVVISVGQHLRPFPLKFYVTRMMDIKQAVTRLLQRSPLTRVFVKLENTRELDFELVRFSDWYGHLQSLALKEVFRGVKVGFIDAWDMTVAANSFAVHPNSNIVHYEIALFLSHLCGPNS